MKLFVDTNIFLDVLLNRERHFKSSKLIMDVILLDSEVDGFLSETSISNIVYIAKRAKLSDRKVQKFLLEILSFYNISHPSKATIIHTIKSGHKDLEDSLQIAGAIEDECEYLITRDKKDFIGQNELEVLTPSKFINKFLDQ